MNLDDVIKKLAGVSQKERDAIMQDAYHATKNLKFIPTIGPQTEAYFSDASNPAQYPIASFTPVHRPALLGFAACSLLGTSSEIK